MDDSGFAASFAAGRWTDKILFSADAQNNDFTYVRDPLEAKLIYDDAVGAVARMAPNAPLSNDQTFKDKLFIDELVRMARTYGWEGDYTEIHYFLVYCLTEKGFIATNFDLKPFPIPGGEE